MFAGAVWCCPFARTFVHFELLERMGAYQKNIY